MSNILFEKASPLFNMPVPALTSLMSQQIDMLHKLINDYSMIDLTDASKVALATIIGGQQPNAAINAAAVLVKTKAKEQGIEIDDQSANVIAQAVTNGVLTAIQVAMSAPPVMASQPVDQISNGASTEVTVAAA